VNPEVSMSNFQLSKSLSLGRRIGFANNGLATVCRAYNGMAWAAVDLDTADAAARMAPARAMDFGMEHY
jgi:hypothetical protein